MPLDFYASELIDRCSTLNIDAVVAQRLKRLPRIVEKLRQYPLMNVTTMQDIGGVRAIVGNIKDAYALIDSYRDGSEIGLTPIRVTDYVETPRQEDGYRSIHLMFRYQTAEMSAYDGHRVELQVRTQLQHLWASAVEVVRILSGDGLIFQESNEQWNEFLALVSEAIARQEYTNPSLRYARLSDEDVRLALTDAESAVGAIDVLQNEVVRAEVVTPDTDEEPAQHFRLLSLDRYGRTLTIRTYDADSLAQAIAEYADQELQCTLSESGIEQVLVSVEPAVELRSAYRSYFLHITEFANAVEKLISSQTVATPTE